MSQVCSTLTLNCFDWNHLLLFLASTTVLPYGLYRIVARQCEWTRKRHKTPTQHFETLGRAVVMMTLLYLLGNQNEVFDSTTIMSTLVSIVAYGLVSEMPSLHTTLPEIHQWHPNMWKLSMVTGCVVLYILWYHLQLAQQVPGLTQTYIIALIVPLIWLILAIHVNGHQNGFHRCKSVFHLHHWTIFYVLAFFTRFPDTISRLAAGAFIGASLHGIAAWDYDTSFENACTL